MVCMYHIPYPVFKKYKHVFCSHTSPTRYTYGIKYKNLSGNLMYTCVHTTLNTGTIHVIIIFFIYRSKHHHTTTPLISAPPPTHTHTTPISHTTPQATVTAVNSRQFVYSIQSCVIQYQLHQHLFEYEKNHPHPNIHSNYF